MSKIAQTQLQLLFYISLTAILSIHFVLYLQTLSCSLNYYKSFAYILSTDTWGVFKTSNQLWQDKKPGSFTFLVPSANDSKSNKNDS